jgi:2-keto-4-pentenoate hydratase/2-oxohepta-3-ene-1,7-dioic acid hydratase in catechol pathway
MVYSGKIYETDGAEAVAVYEADTVRPLSPIPHAPSLRIFRSDLQPSAIPGLDEEELFFFYANPTMLGGASQAANFPETVTEVGVLPLITAVLVSDAYQIGVEQADDIVLGYTLTLIVTSRTAERKEIATGAIGRSHDFGGVIGPVLTTPDELDDETVDEAWGRRYKLATVLRVNGVERARGDSEDFPFTYAQAISAASHSSPLRAGDLIALGPAVHADEPILLSPGDEVQLAVESLGTLSLKLTHTR